MSQKTNLKNKVAAGAVLVALSGFVPQISSNRAHAATATISMSGTFTSGIAMTKGTALQFGIIVATDTGGTAQVKAAGGTSASKAFFNGGTQKAGTIAFKAGASLKVDITVTGMKNTLTLGGATTTGTVNFPTAKLSGPFAIQTFTAAGTTATSVTLTAKSSDINVGGTVTWNAIQPLGTFSDNVKVVVAF